MVCKNISIFTQTWSNTRCSSKWNHNLEREKGWLKRREQAKEKREVSTDPKGLARRFASISFAEPLVTAKAPRIVRTAIESSFVEYSVWTIPFNFPLMLLSYRSSNLLLYPEDSVSWCKRHFIVKFRNFRHFIHFLKYFFITYLNF